MQTLKPLKVLHDVGFRVSGSRVWAFRGLGFKGLGLRVDSEAQKLGTFVLGSHILSLKVAGFYFRSLGFRGLGV